MESAEIHSSTHNLIDIVIIGGGQAALSVAYYLRRSNYSFVILDAESSPGGAWLHGWDSLRLFSPSTWSSLSGWQMPPTGATYPGRDQVVNYLRDYENRYAFPVQRPVWVSAINDLSDRLEVVSDQQRWQARAVISATGTWRNPFIPAYPDRDLFQGEQLHSAHYQSPTRFAGQKVLVTADGKVDMQGTRAVQEPRLWLVGYGEWTGLASATLIGVGRSARATAEEVIGYLGGV